MLFHLLWRMGAFLCQHEASKIKNTIVRKSFAAVVYTACNITPTIEKPIAALSVSSKFFFPLVLHERASLIVYYCDYTPFFPKRHFLQRSRPLQSQTTLLLHTMFRLQYIMYINIPSQYDIVNMAKRFHIEFYAKCKKKKMWWNVYVLHI